MKVIIAGSRSVTSPKEIARAVADASLILGIDVTEVVSGMARGVDTLGERWAAANRIPVKFFPARWRSPGGDYDPAAGFKRNELMAQYADALIAVWDGESRGTADMIRRAESRGLRVYVHPVKSR